MKKKIYSVEYFVGTRHTSYIEAHNEHEAKIIAEQLDSLGQLEIGFDDEVDSTITVHPEPVDPVQVSDYRGNAQEIAEQNTEALEENGEVTFYHKNKFVVIDEHSEGGYNYNIYTNKSDYDEDKDAEDGGVCTGSLADAVGMALNHS